MREAVYQRARAALARQLTAVDPPLSNREIESQHQELEDAVQRLEADYAPPEPEPEPFEEEPAEEPVYYAAPQTRTAYTPPAQQLEARPGDEEEEAQDAEEEFETEAEAEEEYDDDEERRPSRLPALVALGVLVLAVVGLGAYGFAKRDAIFGLFGGGENVSVVSTTATPVTPEPSSEVAAADDPDKVEDRLTEGGATAEEETALAVPETPPPAPLTEEPAVPAPAAVEPPAEEQTAALPPPNEELVAQRAIFYFQGTEGSPARAVEGSVIWTETTRENSPAVQAILRLAEPEVTATVTIYRNLDESLPWSHMVEIEFEGVLGTEAIQSVPVLVLKPNEGDRGEPLAGTDEKVTDELFWIALSKDADAMARNTTLLREGAWFDIPILFSDETRALLTFEKGVPGDRVFETVMAAWTAA
jgi:hypothetical protein